MITGYKKSRLDEGQFRLLILMAKMYGVRQEDILNQLVQNYNELHISELVNHPCSVTMFAEALAKKSEADFQRQLYYSKSMTTKEAKKQQIQTVIEGFDEIY